MLNFFYRPVMRPIIKFGTIFALIFFCLQPFNWYCQSSNSCFGFYFQDIWEKLPNFGPKANGVILLDTVNLRDDTFEIYAEEPFVSRVFSTDTQDLYFTVRNIGKNVASFRGQLLIEPKNLAEKIDIRKCDCDYSIKLKPGEERILNVKIKIDREVLSEVLINQQSNQQPKSRETFWFNDDTKQKQQQPAPQEDSEFLKITYRIRQY